MSRALPNDVSRALDVLRDAHDPSVSERQRLLDRAAVVAAAARSVAATGVAAQVLAAAAPACASATTVGGGWVSMLTGAKSAILVTALVAAGGGSLLLTQVPRPAPGTESAPTPGREADGGRNRVERPGTTPEASAPGPGAQAWSSAAFAGPKPDAAALGRDQVRTSAATPVPRSRAATAGSKAKPPTHRKHRSSTFSAPSSVRTSGPPPRAEPATVGQPPAPQRVAHALQPEARGDVARLPRPTQLSPRQPGQLALEATLLQRASEYLWADKPQLALGVLQRYHAEIHTPALRRESRLLRTVALCKAARWSEARATWRATVGRTASAPQRVRLACEDKL